jgi:hypothetical protein
VCANRSLFETVILVHVYEEDKTISQRSSSAAYIDVQGEIVNGNVSHERGVTYSEMLVLSNGSEKVS